MKFTKDQIEYIKKIAIPLIDDGSNVEYTRGVCELIADIDGKEDVFHEERTEDIRNELLKVKIQKVCKECGKVHDPEEVKRTLGVLSNPYRFGFCSAGCYTKFVMR